MGYYNLGTLKTLQAYNQALWSTLSWLQKARYLITDAYKDFDAAEKIKINNTLDTYIQTNKLLSQKLWTIIQVKTCYGEYNTTIQSLQDFINQLEDAKTLLTQEEEKLQQNEYINAECLKNLENINKTSQMQIDQLKKKIGGYNKTYKADLMGNLKQPMGCLETNMSNIGPSINDAQKAINQFTDNHQNTIDALASQDQNSIKDMCDFIKNDANLNEQRDAVLEKLLQQLQNNAQEKPQEGGGEEPPQNTSKDIQYKNVFEEDELQLLQKIDANNKSIIQKIQETKGTGRYNATKILNKLFENFYGEISTFQWLLKPSESTSQW